MILKIIKPFIPPVGLTIIRKLRKRQPKPILFDGNNLLFKKIVGDSIVYGEYGCGYSTVWTAENTKATIYSVDTSQYWIEKTKSQLPVNRVDFTWVDCGVLENFGRPINYERRHQFAVYANALWSCEKKPDCVLIDGRFRVLCFLTSLKHATEGTKIIFDDYVNRPHYQIVEEILPKVDNDGRQSLFIVPSKSQINSLLLNQLIEKFEYVMD